MGVYKELYIVVYLLFTCWVHVRVRVHTWCPMRDARVEKRRLYLANSVVTADDDAKAMMMMIAVPVV